MNLIGEKINLRFLEERDIESLLGLHLSNRDFFQQYTPLRSDEFYTTDYQLHRIRDSLVAKEADTHYTLGMFLNETNQLIGILALTEVVRGSLQSCWLGYYLDQLHNGCGYMTEAVRLVVEYVFRVLKLHRLEAGIMPHNTGSIRVLEKAGFDQEGLNRKNVMINGKWEDHLHFALVNSDDID